MRIAVDAMGGDFAPREIVAGAVEAARNLDGPAAIVLVGDESAIRAELDRCGGAPPRIEIYHASEAVGMGELPALAVRRKKDSSIGRAVDLVKRGEADAVVSAGNTGAVVVAASLKLRTLDVVRRPAIATVMPTSSNPFILIDAGATIDCDAHLLAQFAAMGSVYSREILGRSKPVVGLLSIGEEDTKGNEVTKEAHRLLSASKLNFRGNVEGHDLFEGETDVVVCDGFMGNVVLKTSESVARAVSRVLKRELTASWSLRLRAALLRGVFRRMRAQLDPETYGGAPLLGVNGVCIITHGASSGRAIYHAVRVACESLQHRLNDRIAHEIKENGF